jgi:excinuclease UvrABC ATPase subunit
MAGEIRSKMAELHAAQAKLKEEVEAEIDALTKDMKAVHADAMEALKMPRAEVAAYLKEVQEVRSAFAPKTNADPTSSSTAS